LPEERARPRLGRRTARPAAAAGTSRRRVREPQLTRTRTRAGTVVAATTGLFGVSSTRRAGALAIVICAVTQQQAALAAEVDELSRRRDTLADPAEVAAQARTRLGYVLPGETPYVVQLSEPPAPEVVADQAQAGPWYGRLWRDVTEGPGS
jgi:cell division protein FtsB